MAYQNRWYRLGTVSFLVYLLLGAPGCDVLKSIGNSENSAMEERVFSLVNRYRREQGLSSLERMDVISEQARQHSRSMASGKVPLGHDGAEDRFAAIRKSIPAVAFSENVGSNRGLSDPAQQVVQGWINSLDHRRNLLGDYDLTGVGIAVSSDSTYYFTQIYIRR
ncbi:MAG: CAP domain-containing protein [Candidatus Latescibacterota bacterium]